MRADLPTAARACAVAAVLVCGAVACGAGKSAETPAVSLKTVTLDLNGTSVVAELADDPELRARGLMERAELAPDHGMLFVYPDEAQRSFWMKNTPLPLSIAFIDHAAASCTPPT